MKDLVIELASLSITFSIVALNIMSTQQGIVPPLVDVYL